MRIDGKKLKALRWQQGWTQTQLAENSRVHINTISAIERGDSKGTPPTALKLAGALGVETGDIVDDEVEGGEWLGRIANG